MWILYSLLLWCFFECKMGCSRTICNLVYDCILSIKEVRVVFLFKAYLVCILAHIWVTKYSSVQNGVCSTYVREILWLTLFLHNISFVTFPASVITHFLSLGRLGALSLWSNFLHVIDQWSFKTLLWCGISECAALILTNVKAQYHDHIFTLS